MATIKTTPATRWRTAAATRSHGCISRSNLLRSRRWQSRSRHPRWVVAACSACRSWPQQRLPPPASIETFRPICSAWPTSGAGAVALHGLAALWLFAGLAIVCDDYFVASLDGAVRSAAPENRTLPVPPSWRRAASAPELFTSVIGCFSRRGDVGRTRLPPSSCLYAMYIVIMYFNESIDQWIAERWPTSATGGNQRLRKAGGPRPKAAAASSNGSHRGPSGGFRAGQLAGLRAAGGQAFGDERKTGAAYWHLRDLEQAEEFGRLRFRCWQLVLGGDEAAAGWLLILTIARRLRRRLRISAGVSQRVAPSERYWCATLPMDAAVMATHFRIVGGRRPLERRCRSTWQAREIHVMGLNAITGSAVLVCPDALVQLWRHGGVQQRSAATYSRHPCWASGCPGSSRAAVRSSPGGAGAISSAGLTYSSVVLLSTVLLLAHIVLRQ
uniref:Uncharacterized protein n=1 Tax=Macrostomum lignano TaxID=282301 RepID=A0A1I8FGU0_9PLAT